MSDKQHRQLRFPGNPEGLKQTHCILGAERVETPANCTRLYIREIRAETLSKRKQHLLFGIILDLNLTQPTNVKDILKSLASVQWGSND